LSRPARSGLAAALLAAARIHGAPSVAAVTCGAGALNMVNAVAAAYAEKSPVVVLSGAPGRGSFHLIDVRIAPSALSPTLRRFAAAIGSFVVPAQAGTQ
jgi:thiamine pyrophosphate-dependent acetolactate synthase large subunit-like protein